MKVSGSVKASVLAFLVAVGCATCGASFAETPVSFKSGPCPADQAKALASLNAACGTLTVPEKRSKPGEGEVQLPVVIVPSKTQPAAPDPIVYMAGGPGANAIAQAQELVKVGPQPEARPHHHEPARDRLHRARSGVPRDRQGLCRGDRTAFWIRRPTETAHVAATKACHDRLVAAGVDLSAFNTSENAADFADLRKALKLEQWNVYGLSYGTELALSPGARSSRGHPQPAHRCGPASQLR